MNLVSNPGWIKKDSKASLAFRGIEKELRIFDRTQVVISQNGDSF